VRVGEISEKVLTWIITQAKANLFCWNETSADVGGWLFRFRNGRCLYELHLLEVSKKLLLFPKWIINMTM
jgi:hypothetical protein